MLRPSPCSGCASLPPRRCLHAIASLKALSPARQGGFPHAPSRGVVHAHRLRCLSVHFRACHCSRHEKTVPAAGRICYARRIPPDRLGTWPFITSTGKPSGAARAIPPWRPPRIAHFRACHCSRHEKTVPAAGRICYARRIPPDRLGTWPFITSTGKPSGAARAIPPWRPPRIAPGKSSSTNAGAASTITARAATA